MDDSKLSTLRALATGPVTDARAPGPIYNPRVTALGDQPILPSAQRVVFGTSSRQPPVMDSGAPGPGTYNLDDVYKPNHPNVKLRGREKFGTEVIGGPADVPGPGAYARLDTNQTRKNPVNVLVRGRRPMLKPFSATTPAPTAYQHPEAPFNASQPISTTRNPPAVKMGEAPRKSMRAQAEALFPAPGPLDYRPEKAVPHVSNLPRVPAATLRSRGPDLTEKFRPRVVPNFHEPVRGLGVQPLSEKRSAPAVSLAGRTKFGSYYG